MCGRFILPLPWSEVSRLLRCETGVQGKPSWNIAPSHHVATVSDTSGMRVLAGARWGFSASWSPSLLINSRSETAAQKPVFSKALSERRCLIPTTGFIEWRAVEGRKQPYLFRRPSGELFVFAGLTDFYSTAGGVAVCCTIMTIAASQFVQQFHDRMPVILDESTWDVWLDRSITDTSLVGELLTAAPEDFLEAVPISPRINNPRNNDEACVIPMTRRP